MYDQLMAAGLIFVASAAMVVQIALRENEKEFPSPETLQRNFERYLEIRERILKDLIKLFRTPGGLKVAQFENQAIFETDNYEAIIRRVADEETEIRGGAEAGTCSPYSLTGFRDAVSGKAHAIILERLSRESTRTVRASIAREQILCKGDQEKFQKALIKLLHTFCD